ncbi:MAG TPA: ABC transporter permease [Thermoanaerobaculia bacterium]|nr:ABC transporter permease [Thermoanaerobaculia bacterium]
MTSPVQDVQFALRAFRKNPLFTASAIVVLALGVGLNAATFSLFDAVVLKSLPAVGHPAQLLDLQVRGGSYPLFRDLRDGSGDVFRGVGAWGQRPLSVSGGGTAEHVRGTLVSAEYFDVLQVRLAAGRGFVRQEEDSGAPVAVVSEAFARRRFREPARAVGGSFLANGSPFTVVGVAPEKFRGVGFASHSDVWMPIGAWPRIATGGGRRMNILGRNWGWLAFFARLKPGVDQARAKAAVDLLVRREAAAYPDAFGPEYRINLRPLARSAAGAGEAVDPARFLGILLGAVGVVLLIACANLANLLLARGAGRRREIAVRQALGASRGRLVRQLLTESILLALLGGAAGLLVASWFVAALARVSIPGGATFGAFGAALDARVLVYAFLLSLLTGGLFGLVPALKGSRLQLLPALKDEPPKDGWKLGLNGTLMAGQVALCVLLLSCAGLFVRSLRNALAADLGFEPRHVATATINLGLARYDYGRAKAFTDELARRAAVVPGVQSVAWAGRLPLSGYQDTETVRIPEAVGPVPKDVDVITVGPGYFAALAMPLSAGREFDSARDLPEGTGAVVVNDAAARRFWPGRSPLGRRIQIQGGERFVVGVVRNSLFYSLEDKDLPLMAVDGEQLGPDALLSNLTLVLRTSGDPRLVLESVRREAAHLDSTLPIIELRTLEDTIGDMLLPQRLGSALLGLFAGLAFLLAEVGVYAVIAGSVARRTRELGIRLALGGRPSQMRRMVIRQTAVPVAVGVAAGLPVTFGVTRLLGRFLYGVAPSDPATLAAAVLLLILGGLAAADLPARRAAGVSPLEALRHE